MATETETKATSAAFAGSEGVYMLPHHASEIERLTKQHDFMATTTDGLFLDPRVVAGDGPLKVLDAGCADGTWLRGLKKQIPNRPLQLHGVDIGSALFSSPDKQQADGIDLREHNVTSPFPAAWGWEDTFDVIHQRLLIWGLREGDWSTAVRNYVDILKPGGALHLVEIEFIPRTPPPHHPDSRPQLQRQAAMQKWSTATFGMDIDIAYRLEDILREGGLVDVQTMQFDHGYGALARDPAQRDVSAELWVECFRTVDAKMPPGGIPDVAENPAQFHDFLDKLEVEIKEFGYQPRLNFVSGRKAGWRRGGPWGVDQTHI